MSPPAKQINQLAILAKSAPAANQPKIQNIIDLYTTRKIPMFSTAFNVVTALASKHKATISSGKAIILYDEVIAKYSPDFTIKTGNHSSPDSYIQFNFTKNHKWNEGEDEPDGRTFNQIFDTLRARPEAELAKLLATNSSMKIRLRLGMEVRKQIIDFAEDEESGIVLDNKGRQYQSQKIDTRNKNSQSDKQIQL